MLGNADFRAMLTPARGETPSKRKDNDGFQRPQKKAFRAPQPRDPEAEKRQMIRAAQTPGAFRDRAKERRIGISVDYEEVLPEEKARELTIEESKYLGGDIEHTHLVKGLDFALLSKVKEDIELAKKAKAQFEAEERLVKEERDEPMILDTVATTRSSAKPTKKAAPKVQNEIGTISAVTTLGRSIRNRLESQIANKQPAQTPKDPLKTLRTSVVFNLSLGSNDDEIPTMITRSRLEAVTHQDRLVPRLPADLRDEMTAICLHIKQHNFKPRPKDKKSDHYPVAPAAAAAAPPPAAELPPEQGPSMPPPGAMSMYDDDDIFTDAPSIYIPVLPEPAVKEPEKVKEVAEKRRREQIASDEYAGCLAGNVEYATTLDSDEDEDAPLGSEHKKSRQEFSSTREYEQYLEMRRLSTAMGPSVAKMKEIAAANAKFDEREAKKKQAREKNKFESDHSKIMKKIEERKSGGVKGKARAKIQDDGNADDD